MKKVISCILCFALCFSVFSRISFTAYSITSSDVKSKIDSLKTTSGYKPGGGVGKDCYAFVADLSNRFFGHGLPSLKSLYGGKMQFVANSNFSQIGNTLSKGAGNLSEANLKNLFSNSICGDIVQMAYARYPGHKTKPNQTSQHTLMVYSVSSTGIVFYHSGSSNVYWGTTSGGSQPLWGTKGGTMTWSQLAYCLRNSDNGISVYRSKNLTTSHTHTVVSATCTKPMHCSTCGVTAGTALGHTYSNSCDISCNRCGSTRSVTHNYNTYVYYWAVHPHYNCYKCSCGDVKENKKETNYLANCADCNKFTEIEKGTYGLKNKALDLYANVSYGIDKQGQNIDTYKDITPFEIKKSDTAKGYVIRPTLSKNRVMSVNSTNVSSGNNVSLLEDTGAASQRWYFQKVSGGYIIRNVQNANYVLDLKNNWDVCVSTYTGANSQIWSVQSSIKYNANGGTGAPAEQMKNYGDSIKISTIKPTRHGHTFLGWSTISCATISSYLSGANFTSNKNVVLYAVWKRIPIAHKDSNIIDGSYNLYAKTFKLSATSYTYNRKNKKPTVTVKNSAGKTLKENTDYTVSYASGRKKVGKYKVTVTMKGNYTGTKVLYFTINPKATTVKKVTAAKKSLKVKVGKQTKEVTGYEIQYSTSKKFKSAKKVTIKKAKTTSTTIKKLKAKKTYYVRVRTYKTVNGKKYYSGWSKAKSKKTK